jgi:hypothetical protein
MHFFLRLLCVPNNRFFVRKGGFATGLSKLHQNNAPKTSETCVYCSKFHYYNSVTLHNVALLTFERNSPTVFHVQIGASSRDDKNKWLVATCLHDREKKKS